MEPAVLEASNIAHDLVDSALVDAVKERLGETGDVMIDVANEYREADQRTISEGTVMTIYSNATEDWDVPEAPK